VLDLPREWRVVIATAVIAAVLLLVAAWVLSHPVPTPRPPSRAQQDLRSYEPTRDKD
jgi:RsiW-degrading membrane proteinase PrsW (M82 family)